MSQHRPNRIQQREARALKRQLGIGYQEALRRVIAGAARQTATPVAAGSSAPVPGATQPTAAPGRTCWFCGAPGPLTREHVVPLWMVNALTGQGLLDHAYAEPGATVPTHTWSHVAPDFKVKVVCGDCNNGWMSKLERDARPIVTSLMSGSPTIIDPADAARLGRWGAKTALLFQALEPTASRVVPRDRYDALRQAPIVPPTLRVWIARVDALGVHQHTFAGQISHRGRSSSMFTALATFDRLAFMVMGASDPWLLQALQLGPLNNAWCEIGQIYSSVQWPGPFVFNHENFMAMPQLLPKLAQIPPGARLDFDR